MSSDSIDATRWSHSAGELDDKLKAEARGDGSAHSSYSGVEEEGSVVVNAKAADLSIVLTSGHKAQERRRKDPTRGNTVFDLDLDEDGMKKDATDKVDRKEGNAAKESVANGDEEDGDKDEKKL